MVTLLCQNRPQTAARRIYLWEIDILNNKHFPIEKEQLITGSAPEPGNLHISEIKQEYKKIDNDWLLVHYRISEGLVLLSIAVEIGISFFLISSDQLAITVGEYIFKYIAVPACINLALIVLATVVMRTKGLPQTVKIYTISLIFVAICFTLAAVHNIFPATYYLFAIAVVLTTVYANYSLTCTTALTGLAAAVISELFIWWSPEKLSALSGTRQSINFLLALFILTASSLVAMIQIRYEIGKNDASIQKELERQLLQERLRTDELTGVFSRKALHDALRNIDANPPESCILAIVDLDKFKGINDCLGHHTGDSYLVAFAKILKENSARAHVYRYGGDEFCLLFYDVSMDAAVATCGQIRQKLSALTFDQYPELKLTASFGLAAYCRRITTTRLFINADQAMYKAKKMQDGICAFTSSSECTP